MNVPIKFIVTVNLRCLLVSLVLFWMVIALVTSKREMRTKPSFESTVITINMGFSSKNHRANHRPFSIISHINSDFQLHIWLLHIYPKSFKSLCFVFKVQTIYFVVSLSFFPRSGFFQWQNKPQNDN